MKSLVVTAIVGVAIVTGAWGSTSVDEVETKPMAPAITVTITGTLEKIKREDKEVRVIQRKGEVDPHGRVKWSKPPLRTHFKYNYLPIGEYEPLKKVKPNTIVIVTGILVNDKGDPLKEEKHLKSRDGLNFIKITDLQLEQKDDKPPKEIKKLKPATVGGS